MTTRDENGLEHDFDERLDVVVFSDDWGRHPSSCQHLVSALIPRYQVYWVNTIGTRPPRLDVYTLRRGWEKIRGWLASRRPSVGDETSNPVVLSPMMWPTFASKLSRWVNSRLLSKALSSWLSQKRPCVAITTIPLTADLIGRLPVERWVYYCVDDLGQWPGLDKRTLHTMERKLVEGVDSIIAVSGVLVERMKSFSREASLLTHGVDLAHWSGRGPAPLEAIERLERPLVVFWGVVDRRLDTEWIRALDRQLESGTIVLIGPENEPDPELRTMERVKHLGALPYQQLPAVAKSAAVLIMPYSDSPAARAIQPLKFKEYLATGLPVVVSRLPAVVDWEDACDVSEAADAFVQAVRDRIKSGVPPEQRQARKRLEGESWEQKAEVFERLIFDGLR